MNTRVDVCEAQELYEGGWTLQQLGDRYGVTRERVRQLIDTKVPSNKMWKGSPTRTQYRRFFSGIAVLASRLDKNRHGTLNRYRGGTQLFPKGCSCEACRNANAAHHRKNYPARNPAGPQKRGRWQ